MTAYPDGLLDARLELNLGGTWTDVTDTAMPDGAQYLDVTSGTPDGADQPDPASAAVTLDNPGGMFSPRNVNGPWYGQLRQNTRARVSVAGSGGTYLRLEEDRASYAYTPLPAVTSGVLDVRMDVEPTDWQACSIAGSAGLGWCVGLGPQDSSVYPPGRLDLETDTSWNSLLVPLPLGRQCLRVTYAVATGTTTFYTAPAGTDLAGGAWTLQRTTSVPVSTLAASTGLYIGAAGSRQSMTGKVYKVSVYGGSAGATPLAYFDATLRPAGTTAWKDSLGNAWTLSGTASITDRDYRLHGELGSIVPTVDSSGANPRAAVQVAGPLRRLQAASAAPVMSPLRRAVILETGPTAPVDYWPMEDAAGAASLANAIPGRQAAIISGAPDLASDTSFAAASALPVLNGAALTANVGDYTVDGAIVVQFLAKIGSSLPSSGYWSLLRVYFDNATWPFISLRVYPSGNIGLAGATFDSIEAWETGEVGPWTPPTAGSALQFTLSVQLVSGALQYEMQTLQPGSQTGQYFITTQPGSAIGRVSQLAVDTARAFTDTAFGHLILRPAPIADQWNMAGPLEAWQSEKAGTRFARVAAENGYAARVVGSPDATQPMGPQPVDTLSAILEDIVGADGGILHEPRDSFSLGYRTYASLLNQSPALVLDYSQADLPGTLQAADDDVDLVNDWTVSQPSGTSARAVLDDPGALTSTVNAGSYQDTAAANVADGGGQLADAAGRMLALSAADEARYRQVAADAGIPGAPAAAIAALRVGDLLQIDSPPAVIQTGPIRQVVTGEEYVYGPGLKATWDCQPASAYQTAIYDDPVWGRADTAGCTLRSAAAADATALPVTSPGVPWTTAAADLPFDIQCGGERMTVTAVKGAANQTLTVTRAQGGTAARALPAGADVRLADTPRYAAI